MSLHVTGPQDSEMTDIKAAQRSARSGRGRLDLCDVFFFFVLSDRLRLAEMDKGEKRHRKRAIPEESSAE